MRKYILIVLLAALVLVAGVSYAQGVAATAETSNENNNTLNLIGPVEVPGDQRVTSDVRTAPNLPPTPYLEIPSYFGPHPNQGWNTQEGSLLPFILIKNNLWKLDKETDHWWNRDNSDSRVSYLTKDKFDPVDAIKVVNGIEGIRNIDYTIVATITTYGGGNTTTVDCFKEAVSQTVKSGGNVYVLIQAGNTPGIKSSTIGLGGSSAGNFSQKGQSAYAAGTAIGYASSTGYPICRPFLQGVSIRVDPDTFKKLNGNKNVFSKTVEGSDVKITKKVKADTAE